MYREHGTSAEHLAENATNGPHINALVVAGRAEQNLRRTVPSEGERKSETTTKREKREV